MIVDPLGPRPDDADQAEEDVFHDRRDYYTLNKTTIINVMVPKMRS
jgi:hypothetical protein